MIGGGLVQLAATLADPDLYDARSLSNRFEAPDHVLYWVAYLMLTAGLPGLFFGQLEQIGKAGVVGFLLALVGSALTMAVSLITAHVLPVTISMFGTAATLTQLIQPGGKLNSLLVPVVLTALTFFPGYILFGVASARARVFPSWCGWLIAAGATLIIAAAAGPPARVPVSIGSVLMGAAWLGFGRTCLVLGSVAGRHR
ncbi:MAG: hypothetical protein M3075_12770 [Candidatus Dormibacteraeota bacterium]|nr:hypothetical protein [Candidatus Dormibacteraeota bacterium]